MRRLVLLAFLLGLAPFAACGGEDPLGAGGSGDAGGSGGKIACAIKIGTGETSFTPLADGAQAEVIYGSQGGYHIWGAFLARGFPSTERLLLTYDLDFEDGTEYRHNTVCVNPLKDAKLVAGWRERAGFFGFLPFEADPAVDLAGGKKLRLSMSLRDGVTVDRETGQCAPTGEPGCSAEAAALIVPCQRASGAETCDPIP